MNSVLAGFKNLSISRFLEELDAQGFVWIAKRLSGNDTGSTGGHQAGVYLPRAFFEKALPELNTTRIYNPVVKIAECFFPSDDYSSTGLTAKYYNNRYFPELNLKKKYDEFRITSWGGQVAPVQMDENTGSSFVFGITRREGEYLAVAWVAGDRDEENIIDSWLGEELEPGRCVMAEPVDIPEPYVTMAFPESWKVNFPSGRELFAFVVDKVPFERWRRSVDGLLLERRELEFQIFERIERIHALPMVTKGFSTVDDFIRLAHSVSNRRMSRAGTSLELNLEAIFREKKLCFEAQAVTEDKKTPDFLFPSGKAYHDPDYPSFRLNMLASKTCCKDRWRQIINEADRIHTKHLFTLQQGVSASQLREMSNSNVELVVPEPHLKSFPSEFRDSMHTLEGFVSFIQNQQANTEYLRNG